MIDLPLHPTAQTTGANCRLAALTFLLAAGISNLAFVLEPATLNAQEWVPRHAVGVENAWPIAQAPIAQASGPTHLVIQAPTPPKHHRPAHHGDSLPQTIVHQDEMPIEDEFGPIDLTYAIPSHANKTSRSIAIPDAPRTTGWKQPYSYGHFGAKHNRQLSIHHGHQRAYTQWTFR